MNPKTSTLLIICVFLSSILFACEEKLRTGSDTPKMKVVATIFPLYDFSREIGRDEIDIHLIIPPGVETHGFEPKPGDIFRIQKADILLYTGANMEPWVQDIIKSLGNDGPVIVNTGKAIASEHDHTHAHKGALDPHIWLDFVNAQEMVEHITAAFIDKDPAHKDLYLNNAARYTKKLQDLDQKFSKAFKSCRKNLFIHGGHFAFGCFTKRYNLTYISAYRNYSPDTEPTPGDLIELVKTLKEKNIHYVFYEELIAPKLAETISRETGAELLLLHGGHNITKKEFDQGVTFISLMEKNLHNLRKGLECL